MMHQACLFDGNYAMCSLHNTYLQHVYTWQKGSPHLQTHNVDRCYHTWTFPVTANQGLEGFHENVLQEHEIWWWRIAWTMQKQGDLPSQPLIYMLNRQTQVGLCCFHNEALIHLMLTDCFETSRARQTAMCIILFISPVILTNLQAASIKRMCSSEGL